MVNVARGRGRWYCIGAAVVVAAGIVGWTLKPWANNPSYRPSPFSFEGASDQLKETVVVPTLDSPLVDGKSAIWCVAFQLAWNRLKDDVAKGPVQLANAQAIADRLNHAPNTEDDLNPDGVFAAAGRTKDGIVEHIRSGMAGKFPNAPPPAIDAAPTGAVAYACLAASVNFDIPFFESDKPLSFSDQTGKVSPVAAFGIRNNDSNAYGGLRKQVEILYRGDGALTGDEAAEFILDPCNTSRPYQVVVARVDRKATLAETLAEVEAKIAHNAGRDAFFRYVRLRDTVLVPTLSWRITHQFHELEGRDKRFLNAALRDYHLDVATQTVQFRLDRSGADLAAEGKVIVKSAAAADSHFHANRPFLVYMKKRDGSRPFFVAWVETAELLEKK
jgi:hypothetical protein